MKLAEKVISKIKKESVNENMGTASNVHVDLKDLDVDININYSVRKDSKRDINGVPMPEQPDNIELQAKIARLLKQDADLFMASAVEKLKALQTL